jgi:antitoxin PrlF
MHSSTITSKSQITIPAAVRDALGLKAGDKIDFIPSAHGFEIVPRRESVLSFHGKYAHLVKKPHSIDAMNDAIRARTKARFAK